MTDANRSGSGGVLAIQVDPVTKTRVMNQPLPQNHHSAPDVSSVPLAVANLFESGDVAAPAEFCEMPGSTLGTFFIYISIPYIIHFKLSSAPRSHHRLLRLCCDYRA